MTKNNSTTQAEQWNAFETEAERAAFEHQPAFCMGDMCKFWEFPDGSAAIQPEGGNTQTRAGGEWSYPWLD